MSLAYAAISPEAHDKNVFVAAKGRTLRALEFPVPRYFGRTAFSSLYQLVTVEAGKHDCGKKIQPLERSEAIRKCSARRAPTRAYARIHMRACTIESFVSELMTATKKRSGRRPKIDEAPGMRAARPTGRPLYLGRVCVPLLSVAVFQAAAHRHHVVRHFRLTGRYRASGEKKHPTRWCVATVPHRKSRRAYFRRRSPAARKAHRCVAVDSILGKITTPGHAFARHRVGKREAAAAYFWSAPELGARKSVRACAHGRHALSLGRKFESMIKDSTDLGTREPARAR